MVKHLLINYVTLLSSGQQADKQILNFLATEISKTLPFKVDMVVYQFAQNLKELRTFSSGELV